MKSEKLKIALYQYQKEFFAQRAELTRMIWNKSRQIGVSFIVALAIVLEVLERGSVWTVLSASERQARDFMEDKIQRHARVLNAILEYHEYDSIFDDKNIRVLEIRFANGGRIFSLPANPKTARGFTGNLFLDEFAHHQDAGKIFQAAYPIVTRRGLKLWIASTPMGDTGKFYDLYVNNESYTKLSTDIYEAQTGGCPVDPELIRRDLGDSFIFDVEYLCKFLSSALSFIPRELIIKCEKPSLPVFSTNAELAECAARGGLYAGYDVGRKQHKSAFCLLQRIDGRRIVRRVVSLDKTTFSAQKEFLSSMMIRFPSINLSIDATGIGMNLAEDLQTRFGENRISGVIFNNRNKETMATRLKETMEDGLFEMPHEADLRRDFASIRQKLTPTGKFRYDAEGNEQHHGDHFWAAALANHASMTSPIRYDGYHCVKKMETNVLRETGL